MFPLSSLSSMSWVDSWLALECHFGVLPPFFGFFLSFGGVFFRFDWTKSLSFRPPCLFSYKNSLRIRVHFVRKYALGIVLSSFKLVGVIVKCVVVMFVGVLSIGYN